MTNLLFMITVGIYTYESMKLRKEVKDLEEKIKCIDKDFWSDDECVEKI